MVHDILKEAKFEFTFLKSRLYKTGLLLSFSSKIHLLKPKRKKEYIVRLDASCGVDQLTYRKYHDVF